MKFLFYAAFQNWRKIRTIRKRLHLFTRIKNLDFSARNIDNIYCADSSQMTYILQIFPQVPLYMYLKVCCQYGIWLLYRSKTAHCSRVLWYEYISIFRAAIISMNQSKTLIFIAVFHMPSKIYAYNLPLIYPIFIQYYQIHEHAIISFFKVE